MNTPARDEAWFTQLFRAHSTQIRGYAMRRSPESADDVVSRVFTTAWRRREQVPDPPLPWLYGVASRELHHVYRTEQRVVRLTERVSGATELATQDGTDDVVSAISARGPVLQALAQLSDQDAELLRLWAWEHLEPAEIAVVLGLTPIAVRTRLLRARRRLRQQIVEHHPDLIPTTFLETLP